MGRPGLIKSNPYLVMYQVFRYVTKHSRVIRRVLNIFYDYFCIENFESATLRKIGLAINSSNSKELKNLLNFGYIDNIDAKYKQFKNKTILLSTCKAGSIECVKVLIDNGADNNQNKNAVIEEACLSGNIELVNYFIGRFSPFDDEIKSIFCQCLLFVKRFGNYIEMAKLLITHAKGSNTTVQGLCLLIASRAGLTDIVLSLLRQGVDRNSQKHGLDALYFASREGHIDVVKTLNEWNLACPISSRSRADALGRACENGHLEVVRYLIDCGADVNGMNNDGDRPLGIAISCNQPDIVALLVENGADVNDASETLAHGGSMLVIACTSRLHIPMARILLEHGADPNTNDCPENNPLYCSRPRFSFLTHEVIG